MTCSFPRSYAIVRQGRREAVAVADLEELIDLRTELEIVRRFGAGAGPGLVEALDRRIHEERSQETAMGRTVADLAELEDMRSVLSDSLAPTVRRAIAEIDRDCPQARAGVVMESINNEADAFHKDVVDKLEDAGDPDIDALLAEFAEVTKDATGQEETGEAAEEVLDADLQALLAETSGAAPEEAGLAELAAELVEPEGDTAEATEAADDVTAMLEELDRTDDPAAGLGEAAEVPPEEFDEAAEVPVEEAATVSGEPGVNIETVTDQVAESLSTAEAQLDAIASAFEVAAAELGEATDDVVQAVGPAAEAPADSADDLAALADWDAEAGADESSEVGSVEPVSDDASVMTSNLQAASASVSFTVSPAAQAGGRATSPPAGPARRADEMRAQLKQARANILSELDDLLVMLERVDQMQVQADETVAKARQFEQAAARAQVAGQALAAAEAEAAKARAAFEQAQARASGARQTWEQAQQEAATAAGQTGGFAPR